MKERKIRNWETRVGGVERKVAARQKNRITRAGLGDGWGLAKAQKSRISSLDGRVLAVKRIADKKGKSPGNDNIRRESDTDKRQMVEWRGEVRNDPKGYKPRATRKVEIPKPGTDEKRTLKIPARRDRTLQTVYRIATDPRVEMKSDRNSFGFRKRRSANDAVQRMRYQRGMVGNTAESVLETDVEKCFDKIAHKVIMEKTPNKPYQIRRETWLKAGVRNDLNPKGNGRAKDGNDIGTPQGSVISPIRCNVALNGREKYRLEGHKYGRMATPYRYADDIVVRVRRPEHNMPWVETLVAQFREERGRNMKKEKTKVSKVTEGFDFLGWNVRKVDQLKSHTKNQRGTVIKRTASAKAMGNAKEIIRQCTHKHNKEDDVTRHYNRRVPGWCNYYSNSIHMKDQFHDRNTFTYERLRKWTTDHGGNDTEAYEKFKKVWSDKRKRPEVYRRNCDYPSFEKRKQIRNNLKRNPYR
jgi:RNA-directed DNA polymerase